MDFSIDIAIDRVEQSGKWTTKCPLCERVFTCFTRSGAEETMADHFNEDHFEPRHGHA